MLVGAGVAAYLLYKHFTKPSSASTGASNFGGRKRTLRAGSTVQCCCGGPGSCVDVANPNGLAAWNLCDQYCQGAGNIHAR